MWIIERDTTDKHGLAVQNADLVSVKKGRGGPKFYIDFSADGLDKIRFYFVGLCVTTVSCDGSSLRGLHMPAFSYAGHFFHMAPPANACDPESCASILAWCVKKLSAAQLEKKSSKDESGKSIIGPTMILSKETLALKPDCISESIDVDI